MPCSDSSSSLSLFLDHDDCLLNFEYAKITCGQEIGKNIKLIDILKGKSLSDILKMSFENIQNDLKITSEEESYVLFLEWDVLRAAIALYIGIDDSSINTDRCFITSIEHTENGVEVSEVILPPKEMPKILPCSLNEQ